MTNNAFTITKNRLNSKAPTQSVQIENNQYSIRLVYHGNYIPDMTAGRIDRNNLVMCAKPKGAYPDIVLMNGFVMIRADFGFLQTDDVVHTVQILNETLASVQALERFIDAYFPA